MKILMLTPYLPYPPSEGGQVRSYNLIKLLSKHHQITLACFTREHNTPDQVEHMRQFCHRVLVFQRGKTWTFKNILRTAFSLHPFLVSIYYSPETEKTLEQEIQTGNYDLIHAETFYTLPYLPEHNLPTILVEQTIMSRIFGHQAETEKRWWLKPFMWLDILKMQFWERHFWRLADRVVTVSQEDAQVIQKIIPGLQVDVVPNGVGEDLSNLPQKLHYNHTILYMGNYKWIQNWEPAEMLARQVFPLIKAAIPDAKLVIAGQFPTPSVKALADSDSSIEVLELEDRDVQGVVNAYLNAGLFVAPMYAPGGTRLKILAAMAAMVPVVTTPIGAEGYGAVDGKSILLGDTPEEIASKSIEVFKDRTTYKDIATNARHLVDTKFSWLPIAKKLESIYVQVLTSRT